MRPEEALAIAGALDEAFVIFDAETGEVMDVQPVREPDKRFSALTSMSRARPTVGRFFRRGDLTAAVLEAQRRDCVRIATRGRLIPELERANAERLVGLLQGREPMDVAIFDLNFEASWLAKALFELHREELTPAVVGRAMTARRGLPKQVGTIIEAYVAGWRGDREALWRLWPSDRPSECPWYALEALLDGYARIDERSEAYVEALIGLMGAAPFGAWFPVVRALGRVGPAAGDRAARLIRKHVFNSEAWIVAVRDRALERVETPDDRWVRCGACDFGGVVDRSEARWRRRACNECLGIAFVRR